MSMVAARSISASRALWYTVSITSSVTLTEFTTALKMWFGTNARCSDGTSDAAARSDNKPAGVDNPTVTAGERLLPVGERERYLPVGERERQRQRGGIGDISSCPVSVELACKQLLRK